MRRTLIFFFTLVLFSAGLLVSSCAALQGQRNHVSFQWDTRSGNPAAIRGLNLTWVSTCDYHLFWKSTFPADKPESAETVFSFAGEKQYRLTDIPRDDALKVSLLLNYEYISKDESDASLKPLWNALSSDTTSSQTLVLSDYLDYLPLNATLYLEQSPYRKSLSALFQSYFRIPVPHDLTLDVELYMDSTGNLDGCFFYAFPLSLESDCVSAGDGSVLFALCSDDPLANTLDASQIPGGWGIYRYANSKLETVYSIPNGGRALHFWSDGAGTLFLLTLEENMTRLTLLDEATVTPVRTIDLLPADLSEGRLPQLYLDLDAGFMTLFTEETLLVVSRQDSGLWERALSADISPQATLESSSSKWDIPDTRMAYHDGRLAVTHIRQGCFTLAVYTADGLAYLGRYTSSLENSTTDNIKSWGEYQDLYNHCLWLAPSVSSPS